MPAKMKKVDGYQVSTPNQVHAKNTSKKKAQRQVNLLNAIDHGWHPTGAKARDLRKSTKSSPPATAEDFARGFKDLGRF